MSEMSNSCLIKCGILDKKSFLPQNFDSMAPLSSSFQGCGGGHAFFACDLVGILCLQHQECHQVTPVVLATWWPFQCESSRSMIPRDWKEEDHNSFRITFHIFTCSVKLNV